MRYICPKCSVSIYKIISYTDKPCEICGAKVVREKKPETREKGLDLSDLVPFPVAYNRKEGVL